jgi:hypothetical protein
MEITGQQNIGQFDTDYNNEVYTSNIHAGKLHTGTPDGLSGASIYFFFNKQRVPGLAEGSGTTIIKIFQICTRFSEIGTIKITSPKLA